MDWLEGRTVREISDMVETKNLDYKKNDSEGKFQIAFEAKLEKNQ